MNRNRRRAITRVELLVVVVVMAVLSLVIGARWNKAQNYTGVSRVRSDMRSLATAIETYRIDHGTYPASTLRWEDQVDAGSYKSRPAIPTRTFRRHSPGLHTLTTPVAYITSSFPDPNADTKSITFRYYADANGWIVGSWGPDVDEATGGQMLWDGGIEKIFDSSLPDPWAPILTGASPRGAYSYNPTNGTISAGDLWRIGVLDPPKPKKEGT